jgi:hypothetical protein
MARSAVPTPYMRARIEGRPRDCAPDACDVLWRGHYGKRDGRGGIPHEPCERRLQRREKLVRVARLRGHCGKHGRQRDLTLGRSSTHGLSSRPVVGRLSADERQGLLPRADRLRGRRRRGKHRVVDRHGRRRRLRRLGVRGRAREGQKRQKKRSDGCGGGAGHGLVHGSGGRWTTGALSDAGGHSAVVVRSRAQRGEDADLYALGVHPVHRRKARSNALAWENPSKKAISPKLLVPSATSRCASSRRTSSTISA